MTRALLPPLVLQLFLAAVLCAPRPAPFARSLAPGGPLRQEDPPPTSSAVPAPTASDSPTPTTSPSASASDPVPSATPSATQTPTDELVVPPPTSDTPTPSETPAPTASLTPTVSSAPPAAPDPPSDSVPAGLVVINEVAWAGTRASAQDEWIELFNTGPDTVDLTGWRLSDGGDISIALNGSIGPYAYYLLERTDDTTILSIAADQIYTGSLNNAGEALVLLGPDGSFIDGANQAGGGWPAGDASSRASMERWGGDDSPGNWVTYAGGGSSADDAEGNPVMGSPRRANSMYDPPVDTPTPTQSAPPEPPTASPGLVRINEIAWAGSSASASDEWIELFNAGDGPVNLDGWQLSDGGDIAVVLAGALPQGGYYLLERTDDTTVLNIPADQIYTGTLSNAGETLTLVDAAGVPVDSANNDGGGWPAGDAQSRSSMERRNGPDGPGSWSTFTGYYGLGKDAQGQPIHGTPRGPNSNLFPVPAPTWVPGKIVINEVLIRPHFDWEGAGGVDPNDEFIELLNLGPGAVDLNGWLLDDLPGAGSSPFTIGSAILEPGEHRAYFRSRTHVALNDGGDTVRLVAPNGRVVDSVSYLRVRAYNLSFGRYPDGSGRLRYGLWPTPGRENLLFEGDVEASSAPTRCSADPSLVVRLPRFSRSIRGRSRLQPLGLLPCVPRPSAAAVHVSPR